MSNSRENTLSTDIFSDSHIGIFDGHTPGDTAANGSLSNSSLSTDSRDDSDDSDDHITKHGNELPHQDISHLPTLNFSQLNKHEYHALLGLSDHTTSFLPRQPCGAYRLPRQLRVRTIDPANLNGDDVNIMFTLYACTEARQDGQFTPNKQYLSIFADATSKNPYYIAEIVTLTAPVPIRSIQPADNKNETKKILAALLDQNPDVEIFFQNDVYTVNVSDLNIGQSIIFIKLTDNNIIRYQERKIHPDRISSYAISDSILGEGTQGAAYRANHTLIFHKNNTVSVHDKKGKKRRIGKLMHDYELIINKAVTRNSAQHEYLMMARIPKLFHAKIPAVNEETGISIIISRCFDGVDLYNLLFSQTPVLLNDLQKMILCLKLAEKLRTLHARGIFHRDLKPENIIVAIDPANNDIIDINIIDFGLSISRKESAVGGGRPVGTPQYAAPEVWQGHSNGDEISDIFSLGRVFWLILSGKHPTDFIPTKTIAIAANMPAFNEIFGKCQPDKSHPDFMHTLYYLLTRMNEKLPSNRITLDEVINNLNNAQKKLLKFIKKSSTPATSHPGMRLFDQRTNSDVFYTPMPVMAPGK